MSVKTTNTFINLPIRNLVATVEFFTKLGFEFNPQFTDATTTCMIVNQNTYIMLLEDERFKGFTEKEIPDNSTSEVILSLSFDSKEEVDEFANQALSAGATTTREPMEQGFMYQKSFQDINDHLWEVFWMDPSAINPV